MALLGSLFGMSSPQQMGQPMVGQPQVQRQPMGQPPVQQRQMPMVGQPPVQQPLPQQDGTTPSLGGLFSAFGLTPNTQPTATPTSEAFPNMDRLKAILNSGVLRRGQPTPMQPATGPAGQAANAASQMASQGASGLDLFKKLLGM